MSGLTRFKVKFCIVSNMMADCNNVKYLFPLVKSMYSNMSSMVAPRLVSKNKTRSPESKLLSKQTSNLVADSRGLLLCHYVILRVICFRAISGLPFVPHLRSTKMLCLNLSPKDSSSCLVILQFNHRVQLQSSVIYKNVSG